MFDESSLEEIPALEKYLSLNSIVGFDTIKFISGKYLADTVSSILCRYYDYLIDKNFNGSLELMYETKNCYRTSVYIDDSKKYEEYLKKFGLPVCLKSTQLFPVYGAKIDLESYKSKPVSEMFWEIMYILKAFGIVDNHYRSCCFLD